MGDRTKSRLAKLTTSLANLRLPRTLTEITQRSSSAGGQRRVGLQPWPRFSREVFRNSQGRHPDPPIQYRGGGPQTSLGVPGPRTLDTAPQSEAPQEGAGPEPFRTRPALAARVALPRGPGYLQRVRPSAPPPAPPPTGWIPNSAGSPPTRRCDLEWSFHQPIISLSQSSSAPYLPPPFFLFHRESPTKTSASGFPAAEECAGAVARTCNLPKLVEWTVPKEIQPVHPKGNQS